jgi:hypothetical protein
MSQKIELGKQYRTRDGREVRIYAADHASVLCVVGIISGSGGALHQWYGDGKFSFDGKPDENDLIEVRAHIKREVWVNVYPLDGSAIWSTRKLADDMAGHRVACVKLTIDCEEGEGL